MALPFEKSERSTIGIEWELQLIDKDSNDLRQAADSVIEASKKGGVDSPFLHREMLTNTIEVTSGARHTVRECADDIYSLVSQIRPHTDALRIDIATAGTHPFAKPAYQRVTDSQRYAELVNRTQYWGRQMLIYGQHVHVGVEDRDKVLPIIKALTTQLGVLQSLAASSPYWAGVETGYASNRAMFFQQLPTAGIPRQFDTWEELESFTDDMLKTGVIDHFNEIRWDIRPSPYLGTIEMRICDAPTNIGEVKAIAALSHCLVEYYSQMYDAGEALPAHQDWFVAENKWRSARYGMDAILITDDQGNEEHVRDIVRKLLVELEPVAKKLNCAVELATIHDILRFGAGYERFLKVAANHGGSKDAVAVYMCREMNADRPIDPDTFKAENLLL
ncbi:MAG: glutamate--cysteine ligase [Actinomycetaceae bacterium]|nr:glutamate--cysteine ligase [Actinomycetaceae bacterium]